MPIVSWCDEYSVNVGEIDIQHQKMLEIVNNLHTAVEECRDKSILKGLLIELVDFTHMHFSTEERYMNEYDFPGSESHKHEHKVLLQHLDNLVAAVSSGRYPTFCSDYDVSSDWFLFHVSNSDKNLGTYLNTKGVT
ncbi:MAG: bacteriohemerythrin [Candidatus Thiodiazotropha sp. (ex. Lucinoma kazani)]